MACITPTENLDISVDTLLCSGTYYLNDSDSNGVFNIVGTEVILQGNDTHIYGANLSGSKPFHAAGNRGASIIKNLDFQDFGTGDIWLYGDGFTLLNVTYNGSNNFRLLGDVYINDSYIESNDTVNKGAIF